MALYGSDLLSMVISARLQAACPAPGRRVDPARHRPPRCLWIGGYSKASGSRPWWNNASSLLEGFRLNAGSRDADAHPQPTQNKLFVFGLGYLGIGVANHFLKKGW